MPYKSLRECAVGLLIVLVWAVCGYASENDAILRYSHDDELGRPTYVLGAKGILRARNDELRLNDLHGKESTIPLPADARADWQDFKMVTSPDGRYVLLRKPADAQSGVAFHNEVVNIVEMDITTGMISAVAGPYRAVRAAAYSPDSDLILLLTRPSATLARLVLLKRKAGVLLHEWEIKDSSVQLAG